MSDDMAIIYRAGGGFPPVDLDLTIDADGAAALTLCTTASLPNHDLDRVGEFAGAVDAAMLARLREIVDGPGLLDRAGSFGQPEPHAPARYLEITRNGQQATFRLNGMMADPELDALEQALQAAAFALTDRPV